MSASGPLVGLRVVDLTRVLSGPFATMLLAEDGSTDAEIATLDTVTRGADHDRP